MAHPTGEAGQYYYNNNQQPDAYYDGTHFDPYNTHHQRDSDEQGASQEPYEDEPNRGLSQGVSSDPLNHNKEDPTFYADEFNATPRRGGCALRLPAHSYFGALTLLPT